MRWFVWLAKIFTMRACYCRCFSTFKFLISKPEIRNIINLGCFSGKARKFMSQILRLRGQSDLGDHESGHWNLSKKVYKSIFPNTLTFPFAKISLLTFNRSLTRFYVSKFVINGVENPKLAALTYNPTLPMYAHDWKPPPWRDLISLG